MVSDKEVLDTAKAYIEARLDEQISTNDVAANANTRKSTLDRVFKEALGMNPGAYIRDCRLGAARALLQSTPIERFSVLDVSEEFYFGSGGSFASAYKAKFGESPGETVRAADP